MNDTEREARIRAALARYYEASGKVKHGKPKHGKRAVKWFSVDEPQGLTSELLLTGQSKRHGGP